MNAGIALAVLLMAIGAIGAVICFIEAMPTIFPIIGMMVFAYIFILGAFGYGRAWAGRGVMTMGLACDRDGYDLRTPQCKQCGLRGCPQKDVCKNDIPAFRAEYLRGQAARKDREAQELRKEAQRYRDIALRLEAAPPEPTR